MHKPDIVDTLDTIITGLILLVVVLGVLGMYLPSLMRRIGLLKTAQSRTHTPREPQS